MVLKLSSRMGLPMMSEPLCLHNGETAFERRFQAVLRSAWKYRTWHVIVADPGSGKTTGIIDLVRTTGSPSGTLSGRCYPILAVICPKGDENEQTLGNYLYRALGLPLRGHWSERKCKLMGLLVQHGVQCLVFDDAHDISIPHLTFIKELTDQGCLPPYNHRLGLCLVTAGRGNVMPLKETIDQPETLWIQFRHRLDKLQPFCRIAGHTSAEVQEILATLETACRETFPQLNLRQWSESIYSWLTHPLLDPTGSGRVVMDHVMKLVSTALEWSYEAGETDVSAETLQAAAELLTLGRDTIRLIDGAGPMVEIPQSDTVEQGSVPQAEAGEALAKDAPKQRSGHHDEVGETHRAVPSTNCSFSGPIELEAGRLLESIVEVVQCPACGSVSKAKVKGQSVVISPHPKRQSRPVRNVTRWMEQGTEWILVQKKE
jgi:hypothetical protein